MCIKIHGNGIYFIATSFSGRGNAFFIFFTFSFLLLLHPHTNTHMNYQSLAAFYVFTIYLWCWRWCYTQNIPLGCSRLKLYCSRHGLYQRAPENYSASFHFFCLKKQCNCFRVFNDTTQLSQYSTVQPPCAASAFLSFFLPCGSCSTQYNSGALQLQKFFFFPSTSMLCVCVCVNEQFSALIWSTKKKRNCTRVEDEEKEDRKKWNKIFN